MVCLWRSYDWRTRRIVRRLCRLGRYKSYNNASDDLSFLFIYQMLQNRRYKLPPAARLLFLLHSLSLFWPPSTFQLYFPSCLISHLTTTYSFHPVICICTSLITFITLFASRYRLSDNNCVVNNVFTFTLRTGTSLRFYIFTLKCKVWPYRTLEIIRKNKSKNWKFYSCSSYIVF